MLCIFQAFSGRDASQAYLSYHRRHLPQSSAKAKAAFLRSKDYANDVSEEDSEDFIELCRRVDKVGSTIS